VERAGAPREAEANREERAPDLRRGGMTVKEQLLILEQHPRWGKAMCRVRKGGVRSHGHSLPLSRKRAPPRTRSLLVSAMPDPWDARSPYRTGGGSPPGAPWAIAHATRRTPMCSACASPCARSYSPWRETSTSHVLCRRPPVRSWSWMEATSVL
jgi:hypothetical protein